MQYLCLFLVVSAIIGLASAFVILAFLPHEYSVCLWILPWGTVTGMLSSVVRTQSYLLLTHKIESKLLGIALCSTFVYLVGLTFVWFYPTISGLASCSAIAVLVNAYLMSTSLARIDQSELLSRSIHPPRSHVASESK